MTGAIAQIASSPRVSWGLTYTDRQDVQADLAELWIQLCHRGDRYAWKAMWRRGPRLAQRYRRWHCHLTPQTAEHYEALPQLEAREALRILQEQLRPEEWGALLHAALAPNMTEAHRTSGADCSRPAYHLRVRQLREKAAALLRH